MRSFFYHRLIGQSDQECLRHLVTGIRSTCVLATVAIIGVGCASTQVGTKIASEQVEEIRRGATTRAQIESMFGSPTSVQMRENGTRILVYRYRSSESNVKGESFIPYAGWFLGGTEGETYRQRLQVKVGRNGVVEDYEYNEGTSDVETTNNPFDATYESTPASGNRPSAGE